LGITLPQVSAGKTQQPTASGRLFEKRRVLVKKKKEHTGSGTDRRVSLPAIGRKFANKGEIKTPAD